MSTVSRKEKECARCNKKTFLFGRGRCENCYKILLWEESFSKKKKQPSKKNKPKKKTLKQNLIRKLDTVFSKYIRLRNTGPLNEGVCISSGRFITYENSDAGHFISRRKMTIRWDERNVNAQSRFDNRFNEGNRLGYIEGIKKKYGEGIVEELEILSRIGKAPDCLQMREMIKFYEKKVIELSTY